MAHLLIVFSTVDGHTRKICQRLQQVIAAAGHAVTVAPLDDAERLDLPRYDVIVIGASIRYGHHRPAVADFIRRNQPLLERRPSAFFTVNIVARKPEKNQPHTNPYLKKFLRQIRWQPQLLGVFAGKLDYPRYGFFDRMMIRFIMLLTHGPTDPQAVVEFTDWDAVEAFGQRIAALPAAAG